MNTTVQVNYEEFETAMLKLYGTEPSESIIEALEQSIGGSTLESLIEEEPVEDRKEYIKTIWDVMIEDEDFEKIKTAISSVKDL